MAKRDRTTTAAETEEERKERKRLKKEAKKQKKQLEEAPSKKKATSKVSNARPRQSSSHETSNVFFQKKLALSVSILPNSLGDVVKSIEDCLRRLLLKYSDGVEGVLLAFENVKTLGKGSILHELPHIHYDVEVDALVFRPLVGCNLSGAVTESSFHSHLSLVVYRYFNASISAENMRNGGFEFDDVMEHWYWKEGETTHPIEKGDSIDFVCQKIHESGGIISLEGSQPTRS